MSRTITNPASSSPLSSSTMRTELQTLEDEVANIATGHDHDGVDSKVLAALSVDTAQLVDDAVTGAKIADAAVTPAMMAATAWTVWTTTTTGWSGTPTQVCAYIQLGKIVICRIHVEGTSNSTSCTITLPVAAKVSLNNCGFISQNAGIISNYPGRVDTVAGSTTANVYKQPDGAGWTASGIKLIRGILVYEAN